MDKKRGPGIYLLTDTGNLVEITLTWMDGQETHFPRSLPRRRWWTSWVLTLGDYRSRVEGLWEEHCVFEERDEVPYIDLLDLRKDGPAWETITAESQILRAQGDMRASMTGIRETCRRKQEVSAQKLEKLVSGEKDADAELLAQMLRKAAEISRMAGPETEEEY